MKRPRVVVMIDQASRDGFSQLLVVQYLRWRGVKVVTANQGTLIAVCEWFRPHVVLASWLVGGSLMDYLSGLHRYTHVVLIDQEGGKLGEHSFKRSFDRLNGAKCRVGRYCARVLSWGASQAQWLAEASGVEPSRIRVTGSPRLDPYLTPAPTRDSAHLGVTLRGDLLTARPFHHIENVFRRLSMESLGGISVGYPIRAQQEDRIWHVLASTRYILTIVRELSRRTSIPIVMRPGPWERHRMYAFLPQHIPTVTIGSKQSQPEYIRNSFAVLDEASSLGLEAYVAGKPAITIQALVPRLEEHIGGPDGGLFNAPYARAYWRPKSVEEAVELVLKAEQGALAPAPVPEVLDAYLRECHSWPRSRPSSFQIADAILELLDVPPGSRADGEGDPAEVIPSWKRQLYRYVPGASRIPGALLYTRTVAGPESELFRRYHYFRSLYPYGGEVSRTFRALLHLTREMH